MSTVIMKKAHLYSNFTGRRMIKLDTDSNRHDVSAQRMQGIPLGLVEGVVIVDVA